MGFNSGFQGLTSFLIKLEYCIQQYPSNVNNWNPNRTPNKPDKDLFLY